ncbi:MAG: HEAT repeat domain-containing protein [Planctomycetia bacterium]|nr:HEAT repeat domain-containing protein [Planctomycetia bacterium]
MQAELIQLLESLREYPPLSREEQAAWRERARGLTLQWPAEAEEMLSALVSDTNAVDGTLDAPLTALLSRLDAAPEAPARVWTPALLDQVSALMQRLRAAPTAQTQLLRSLVLSDDPAVLACWTGLFPVGAQQVDTSLTPLFQRRTYDVGAIFPALLESLSNPRLASGVLDLANFLFRSKRCQRHPAAERVQQLATLLGAMAQRLKRLEETPFTSAAELKAATEVLDSSLSLVIALCDALALIGDASVIGKLNQVLELRHRRLRAEAACAIARLGDKSGVRQLVALTHEPAVRTRALAYLEEVGALDKAPAEMRSSAARGEGDLAAWLAEPAQFGLAPQQMELVDSQTMHWPGFDEQVECHLFRFEYALPQGGFSGVGLAGPAVHALGIDLLDYPPADIFAIYCGWQAEHAELRDTDAAEITAGQRATADRYLRRLSTEGFHQPRLVKLAHFFGEEHFVFEAIDDEHRQPGVVVIDGGETFGYPQPLTSNPPGERELYWLHRGRKLLAIFNAPR